MNKNSKVLVLGSGGLVGGAILKKLKHLNYENILHPRSSELNLLNTNETLNWFKNHSPEYVFFSAAKVGGIQSNIDNPVEFAEINTNIINNTLRSAHTTKVKKLLFFGSSCIYPKNCPQPMKEEYLMTGELEPTNEMYSLSKIYGIKLCQSYRKQYNCNFISCQPCNVYGPGDNFDPIKSHVIAALIRKFSEAVDKNLNEVICWGDGSAKREFIHCDDLADASIFLMNNYSENELINVGSGEDISIKDLTHMVANISNYKGNIIWDTSKSNGMPRKLLNVEKINKLGWKCVTKLNYGIRQTYEWYMKYRGKI